MKVETTGKIHLDSCDVSVTLGLESKLPKPIECSSIQMAVLLCDPTHDHHALQNQAQSQEQQNLYQNLSNAAFSASAFNNNTPSSGGGGKGSSGGGSGSRKSSKDSNKNLRVDGGSGNDRHSKIERKESVSPLTCEDEDVCLSLNSETNLSNIRLELGQSFDTKQDKTIQGGRILCHNPHQALR